MCTAAHPVMGPEMPVMSTVVMITVPVGLTLSCWSLFQIKGMKERLDFWCDDVKNMAVLVEQQAHDILT